MQRILFKYADDSNKTYPTVSLVVKKTSLISHVKEILATKLNIHPSRILLSYNGTVLSSSNSIGSYEVTHSGFVTFHVIDQNSNSNSNQISITLINGPGVPIKVKKNLTIAETKSFISKILNIPVDNINFENASMNENTIISDLPLNNDGTLHFIYKYKLFNFYVYLPNNLIAKSRCRDFANIETIKSVLARKLGVPPESTILTYNNEILANDTKIRDVKLTLDGIFRLENYKPKSPVKKINIKIANCGVAKVRFNEKATVGKAKEKLAQVLDCQPQDITLLVNDPSVNDNSLMKDIDVESEGTIKADCSPSRKGNQHSSVSPVKNITIRLSNGLIAKGRYTDTATFKKMKEVLAKTLNTTPESLSIINNEPDDALIKDINVNHDLENEFAVEVDDEYLRPVTFNITDGKKVNAHFKDSAKIGRIKEILGRTLNVSPDRIVFNFSRWVGNAELLKNVPIGKDGVINTTIKSLPVPNEKEVEESAEYNYSTIIEEEEEEEIIEEEEEEEEEEKFESQNSTKNSVSKSSIHNSFNKNQKENNSSLSNSKNKSSSFQANKQDENNSKLNSSKQKNQKDEDEDENEYSEIKSSFEVPSGSPGNSLILRTQSGLTAKTRFKDTATVGKLKNKMAEVLDTNPGNVSLTFDHQEVDDHLLVKDIAPAQDDGSLLLKQSPTKLKVVKPLILRLEDGTELKSRFRMATTIGKVKDVLGSVINVNPSHLVFYYEDTILTNDLFLSEIDILDNECIYVSKEY